MITKKLNIKTKTDNYNILIGSNLVFKLSKLTKVNSINSQKYLFIIDKNVPKKMILKVIKSFNAKKIYKLYIVANEKNKNQKNVFRILNILLKKNFSRQDCLISIGGGITGDITGFSASLFKRGLKFINVPTTLLSQVDSSIGGKTGINTEYGKNLIGSFYQPNLVVSDTNFLKTLSKKQIICGYGEILKHSLITKKKFYNYLNKNIFNILNLKSPFIEKAIFESCKIKKKIVEKDEKEKNLRKILNFGHTFGHAYEAALNYSNKLNHGEAVILGMSSALKFSLEKKLINYKEFNSIIEHLKKSKLPINIKDYFSFRDIDKIIYFMTKDKKNNSDKIKLILLKRIGKTEIKKEFSKEILKSFLKRELIN